MTGAAPPAADAGSIASAALVEPTREPGSRRTRGPSRVSQAAAGFKDKAQIEGAGVQYTEKLTTLTFTHVEIKKKRKEGADVRSCPEQGRVIVNRPHLCHGMLHARSCVRSRHCLRLADVARLCASCPLQLLLPRAQLTHLNTAPERTAAAGDLQWRYFTGDVPRYPCSPRQSWRPCPPMPLKQAA